MSDTDPLARERFRTILLGPIEAEAERIWDDHGISYGDDAAASEIVGKFPESYFERRTNDNGVRMRRVVVIGEWEVDPMPAVKRMPEPCETESCYDRNAQLDRASEAIEAGADPADALADLDERSEPLNTGRCADPACSAAYIPNHSHLTQAGQQVALTEVLEALRADSDDPLAPGPVFDPSKRHPYVDTLDHGRSIGLCSHLTMISGHEGILCYATRSDPIHSI